MLPHEQSGKAALSPTEQKNITQVTNTINQLQAIANNGQAPETQLTSTDLVSFTFNLMSGINEFGFNCLIQFSDQYTIDSTGFRAEFQTNPTNPSVITMN